MSQKEEYRLTCKTGDIVRMPNGVLARVKHWDITANGITKRVFLRPLTGRLQRIWLFLTTKTRFFDDEINQLEPVHMLRNTY